MSAPSHNVKGPIRRVLQIDGGGIKGIIPATVLKELERKLREKSGKRLNEVFDLILGSSTGAIIGAGVASGVSAEHLRDLYDNEVHTLFRPRFFLSPSRWLKAKYRREPFLRFLRTMPLGDGGRFGQLNFGEIQTRCLLTAYNLDTQRTHFLKSWDPSDAGYRLADVVSWSALSAFYYFGSLRVPDFTSKNYDPFGTHRGTKKGAVFQDGGQGFYSNTLSQLAVELLAQGWDRNEGVTVVSLGCGTVDRIREWRASVRRDHMVGNLVDYVTNQALKEAVVSQVLSAQYIASRDAAERPWLRFRRFDIPLSKSFEGIDKLRFKDYYRKKGEDLAAQVDDALIQDLLRP